MALISSHARLKFAFPSPWLPAYHIARFRNVQFSHDIHVKTNILTTNVADAISSLCTDNVDVEPRSEPNLLMCNIIFHSFMRTHKPMVFTGVSGETADL